MRSYKAYHSADRNNLKPYIINQRLMRPAVWRYIGIKGKMALDFTKKRLFKVRKLNGEAYPIELCV